jgi:NTE family protein
MNDEVIPLLKVHEYFQGASDEALEEVVRLGQVAQCPAGSIVHEADALLTTVGFVWLSAAGPPEAWRTSAS